MSLVLTISPKEFYNESTGEFVTLEAKTIELEHNLISLSKWEAKHHKPFMGDEQLTESEMLDYIKCMCTEDVDDVYFLSLSSKNVNRLKEYINDPMTATKFYSNNPRKTKEPITSELIYYWMIAQNIPVQFEHWHLNRLLTLIRLCSVKQEPHKKMSQAEIMRQNARLNAQRRAKLHSRG